MNPSRSRHVLWIVTATILLVGVGLSFQTVQVIHDTGLRVETKLRNLEMLKAMADEASRGEAAREAVAKMPSRSADPLLPQVQSLFAGYKAEDCRETRRDLTPGWIARQTEVSFNEVAFADVMALVRDAEAMHPPWRLAKCAFRASPAAPGVGAVVLLFEAVQRRD